MIRDHKLVVLYHENEQLPLGLELFDAELRDAVTRLGGTVWQRTAWGLFITWEFSTYLSAGLIRTLLDRRLPGKPRWYVQTTARVEYGNLSPREVQLLLDFTGLRDRKSA